MIHPLVRCLRSKFKVFYLDDGTLGSTLDQVLVDLQMVDSMASTLGLQLNHRKSELICEDLSIRDAMLLVAPDLKVVSGGTADLLGSPIGTLKVSVRLFSTRLNSFAS